MQRPPTAGGAFDRVGISVCTSSTTGASTKELMARMGHASPRAALIYQHATKDRDASIAAALSDLVEQAAVHDKAPVLPLTESRVVGGGPKGG